MSDFNNRRIISRVFSWVLICAAALFALGGAVKEAAAQTNPNAVTFTADDVTVDEGVGTATIVIRRTVLRGVAPDSQEIVYSRRAAVSTAEQDTDYTIPTGLGGRLTFSGANTNTVMLLVNIADDMVAENQEHLRIGLEIPLPLPADTDVGLGTQGTDIVQLVTLYINDNDGSDTTITLTDNDDDDTITEGDTVTFTVTLGEAATADVNVPVTVTSSTSGLAFTTADLTSNAVTFTTGQITEEFTVTATDNDNSGGGGTLTVAVDTSGLSGYTAGATTSAEITVNEKLFVTVQNVTVTEGGTAEIVVMLDAPAPAGFKFTGALRRTNPVEAVPEDFDVDAYIASYTSSLNNPGPNPGFRQQINHTFTTGERSYTIFVPTTQDQTSEGNETAEIHLFSFGGAPFTLDPTTRNNGNLFHVDITIEDDEAKPHLEVVAPDFVYEGESFDLTIRISNGVQITSNIDVYVGQANVSGGVPIRSGVTSDGNSRDYVDVWETPPATQAPHHRPNFYTLQAGDSEVVVDIPTTNLRGQRPENGYYIFVINCQEGESNNSCATDGNYSGPTPYTFDETGDANWHLNSSGVHDSSEIFLEIRRVEPPTLSIASKGDVDAGQPAVFTVTAGSKVPVGGLTVNLTVDGNSDTVVLPYGETSVDYSVSTMAGDAGNTVTVSIAAAPTEDVLRSTDDGTPEGSMTDTVSLYGGAGSEATITLGGAVVTTPAVTITSGPDVEEGEAATFTLSLNPAPSSAVMVNLTVGGSNRTETVSAASHTFTVPTTANGVYGTVSAAVSATVEAGAGYTPGSANTATVTLTEGDVPIISLEAPDFVHEGETITVTVKSDIDIASDLLVRLSRDHANPGQSVTRFADMFTAGDNGFVSFSSTPVNVTIPMGQREVVHTIATTNHRGAKSGDGYVLVAVRCLHDDVTGVACTDVNDPSGGHPAGYNRHTPYSFVEGTTAGWTEDSTSEELIRIAEVAPPVISVRSDGNVAAGATAAFTVYTADTIPSGGITVNMSAVGNPGGVIASTPPTTVNFTYDKNRSGEATAAYSVLTVPNTSGAVTATVGTGSHYSPATSPGNTAEVTVGSSAPAMPTVTITGGSDVTEGTPARFTLNLSESVSTPLTVNITAANGTGEFIGTPVPTTVTVPQNTTTQNFTVPTDDDTTDEADGSVRVTVNSGTGYTPGSSPNNTATVNVSDNDVPVVTISGGQAVTEGTNAGFTLNVSPASYQPFTVNIAVVQNGDFIDGTSPATVSVPANATTQGLNISTDDDGADEANGSISVTVNSGTGYTVGSSPNNTATVNVSDNDGPPAPAMPAVTISGGSPVTEGTAARFTLNLSESASTPLTVNITAANGTGDFIGTPVPTTVTVPQNTTTQNFTVPTDNDGTDEADGSVRVTVNSGTGYTVGSSPNNTATVNVSDNDVPVVTISGGSAVTEGTDAVFTFNVSPVSYQQITVNISASGTPNDIIVGSYATVSVPAGAASQVLNIRTLDDSNYDGDGSVRVTVAGGTGYTAGSQREATVTVRDDETPPLPLISICPTTDGTSCATSAVEIVEGQAARFLVSISSAQNEAVEISATVSPGGGRTVAIPANMTSVAFSVGTTDDSAAGGGLTVAATIANPDAARFVIRSGEGAAQVAVVDNDKTETVDGQVVEINNLPGDADDFTVTITRDAPATPPTAEDVEFASVFRVEVTPAPGAPFELCLPLPSPATGDPVIFDSGNNGSSWTEREISRSDETAICATTASGASFRAIGFNITPSVDRANRAITPRVAMVIASEVAHGIQGRIKDVFSGGDRSGFSIKGRDLQQTIVSGARSGELPELKLSDLAFTVAAADAYGAGWGAIPARMAGNINAWGRGYFLLMEDVDTEVEFDGTVTGGMGGFDTLIMPNFLAGVAGNYFMSDIDFRGVGDGNDKGTYEMTGYGVHPYVGWQPSPRTFVWGTGGYGMGEINVGLEENLPCAADDEAGCRVRDMIMLTFGGGASGTIFDRFTGRGGRVMIDAVVDGVYARLVEDGDGGINADAGSIRVGLEISGSRAAWFGTSLGGDLLVAYRGDFGDGVKGSGLETAGSLKAGLPRYGLRLELGGRALISHSDSLKERGLSAVLKWSRDPGGTGPFVLFSPQWGAMGDKRNELWEQGINEVGIDAVPAGVSYEFEAGYGVPLVGESGVMKLFARSEMADGETVSRAGGVDVKTNLGISAGYEAVSEAARTEAEHRGYIRFSREF